MNQRRKEIMRELGLTPFWRKKQGRTPTTVDTKIHDSNESDSQHLDRTKRILRLDWPQLKAEVENCHACPLSQARLHTVFGVGDEQADWLFIGEGPGAREDEIGEPFVGQAGKLLDSMLAAIQLKRGNNVYITNIVKCRPPNNRNPECNEAEQCRP
ncbi:MAG TPA: uracil-DNA glycosylase, partial [Nitrosomonas sp.]|nr:uracil-DNA glycosylase [Nitrosomonas sp.]